MNLDGLERDFWLGSEIRRLGGYEFKGTVYGIDGVNQDGRDLVGVICRR
jgi:hypothetical protein